MSTISIDLPETAFPDLGKTHINLGREILVAAVVKWFELGTVSQGKAAEILGISRAEFLEVLSDYRVSAWQYTKEELDEELNLD
jgi:predicted HTH domain antitoxin